MLTFAKITFFCAEGLFTKYKMYPLAPVQSSNRIPPHTFYPNLPIFTPIYLSDLNTFMCLAIVSDVLGLAYKLRKSKKNG